MVRSVRASTNVTLIVGGGIRSPEKAVDLARAGAHIIVTGNVIEKDVNRAAEIIKALNSIRAEDVVE